MLLYFKIIFIILDRIITEKRIYYMTSKNLNFVTPYKLRNFIGYENNQKIYKGKSSNGKFFQNRTMLKNRETTSYDTLFTHGEKSVANKKIFLIL